MDKCLTRGPEPRPRPPTIPTDFIVKTVGPLNQYKDPRMADVALNKFRVAITTMDFNTAKVDAKCRRLLRLTDARDIQSDASQPNPGLGV